MNPTWTDRHTYYLVSVYAVQDGLHSTAATGNVRTGHLRVAGRLVGDRRALNA